MQIIGTFYTTKKEALKKAKKGYSIVKVKGGYIVYLTSQKK